MTKLAAALGEPAERRESQRIPLECNALVRISESLTFRARLRNASTDAVQVTCDPRYALLVHPGGDDQQPDATRHLEISVALPGFDEANDFRATCQVKYCVARDDGQMLMGLQFVSMESRSMQLLDRFMASRWCDNF